LNANVMNIMKNLELDKEFGSIHSVEPDEIKQGISRAALSRFLNLPIETICPSADNLRLVRCFEKEGSGSSGLEFRRPAADAASVGLR
jgi:hypothetical protein